MALQEIEKTISEHVTKIRKGTGLNQEQFFDQYEIGKYIRNNITSGPGKSGFISELESGKRVFPAVLLPVYANIGNCSVDDILGISGDEKAFKTFDPVYRAVDTIASSAYDTCRILYELYLAAAIRIELNEEGGVFIQIANRGNIGAPITSSISNLSIYMTRPGNRVKIEDLKDRASLIADFLKTLKDVYENPQIQDYIKDYRADIITGKLQYVKDQEDLLQQA